MSNIQTNSSKNVHQSMNIISETLGKIGIKEDQIVIRRNTEENYASVEWVDGNTPYKFECRSQKDVRTNLAALALFLEGRIRNIRRGIEKQSSAFAGYKQIGYGGMEKKATPYATLGLSDHADWESVKIMWKVLVKKHHPDVGGDQKNWDVLQEAYETIKELKGAG